MKFSDNTVREEFDIVNVIRTEEEMKAREEYDSNLWDEIRSDFPKKGVNMYSTPCRDVKFGETIYTKKGENIAYRSN